MKEVKRINVSIIGALIFFSCAEMLLQSNITSPKYRRKMKARETIGLINTLEIDKN